MSPWEIAGLVVGAISFLVWIPCLVLWIRRGLFFPRYLHWLAAALTTAGLGCLIGLAVAGILTAPLAIALLILPPTLTYFGWLWLFGPEFASR